MNGKIVIGRRMLSLCLIAKILMLISVYLFYTFKLPNYENAQPYEIAPQRIQEAYDSQDTYLTLSDLGLTELPAEIGSLTQLQVLDLSENNLTNLPQEIENIIGLRQIHLSYNHYSRMPMEITKLPNLDSIWLDNNDLRRIPQSIASLDNLQKLYLDGNELNVLPNQLGYLDDLTVLSLTYNNLDSLPRSIANLKNLCYIDFGYNYFEELPFVIGEMHPITPNNQCEEDIISIIVEPNPYDEDDEELAQSNVMQMSQTLHDRMKPHEQNTLVKILTFGFGLLFAIRILVQEVHRITAQKKKRKIQDLSKGTLCSTALLITEDSDKDFPQSEYDNMSEEINKKFVAS
ncbi:MAG: leucine-rich repeat domain-containing protein [Chloroflexota bacterium]